MATSSAFPDLSPDEGNKSTSVQQATGSGDASRRTTCRPASASPSAGVSLAPSSQTQAVLSSDSTTTTLPTRVVGWKSSKSFSKTTSSIDVATTGPLRVPVTSSTSRPAAIRIQMMEPVGPSAYSLSLQAQRTSSEQWKMLKNRLLRKKSTEESVAPEIDKIKSSIRITQQPALTQQQQQQEDGIVFKTTELKRLLRTSDTSEDVDPVSGTRSSNRSSCSLEEGELRSELCDERKNSKGSPEPGKESEESEGTESLSKVKWDEVRIQYILLSLVWCF